MMNNMMAAMLQQLKSNPLQFIMKNRANIPQNMDLSDPNAITNYLLQTGQRTQQQLNAAYQMAQQFR